MCRSVTACRAASKAPVYTHISTLDRSLANAAERRFRFARAIPTLNSRGISACGSGCYTPGYQEPRGCCGSVVRCRRRPCRAACRSSDTETAVPRHRTPYFGVRRLDAALGSAPRRRPCGAACRSSDTETAVPRHRTPYFGVRRLDAALGSAPRRRPCRAACRSSDTETAVPRHRTPYFGVRRLDAALGSAPRRRPCGAACGSSDTETAVPRHRTPYFGVRRLDAALGSAPRRRPCRAACRSSDTETAVPRHRTPYFGVRRLDAALGSAPRRRPCRAACRSSDTETAVPRHRTPLAVMVSSQARLVPVVSGASLICLAALGAIAARTGGASAWIGAARVAFWGALAMAVAAGAAELASKAPKSIRWKRLVQHPLDFAVYGRKPRMIELTEAISSRSLRGGAL